MKFRFTIGRKIGTGFGSLIFFIIITFGLTYVTLKNGIEIFGTFQKVNDDRNNIFDPSKEALDDLTSAISESRELIRQWVNVQSREDDPFKIQHKNLTKDSIPRIISTLHTLSKHWDPADTVMLGSIEGNIKELFAVHQDITSTLNSFESYLDPTIVFLIRPMVESGGEIDQKTDKVLNELKKLSASQDKKSNQLLEQINTSSRESSDSFDFLQDLVIYLGIALMVGGILIAVFTVSSIVRPIQKLKEMLLNMAKGRIPANKMSSTNDEIGEMTKALNSLIDATKHQTDFANEVGSGNFDYQYKPLSQEDTLGYALLKMRDDLAENERVLEQKVIERTEEVVRQKEEIEKQNQKLGELYKDITDSIRYAKRLQDSILPPEGVIKSLVPDSFVLFKPKDIVSGDFYWFREMDDKVLYAAVDCTGHGVPGAFMSLVGHNGLNQAVREHKLTEPAKILDDLNKLASEALNKNRTDNSVRDGMDLAICAIDKKGSQLEYAGANNPLYLIREGELSQIKADKMPIGAFEHGKFNYTNHVIDVKKGDVVYIFSDGYADQFGGSKGKKFMYKKFRDLLMEIHQKPMLEQHDILNETIEKWKGTFEQLDDILVIGVRI